MGVTEPEINARLDSLCLSMTEHALGGFNEWSTASYNGKTGSIYLIRHFLEKA